MIQFVPAILTNDKEELIKQVGILQEMVDLIQLDVMDGTFVDNLTVEVDQLLDLNFSFQVEMHLMVDYPKDYAIFCKDKRIVRSIFHFQSKEHPATVIDHFKKYDVQVGMAINPEVQVKDIIHLIPELHSILIMGVKPGLQGQSFIPEVLEKISEIRNVRENIQIGIDGGIKLEMIPEMKKQDINYICVGSGIWKSENTQEQIRKFQTTLQGV